MIKILIILNQSSDSTFFKSLLKREIERTGLFKVVALVPGMDEGLDIAGCSYPELLIFFPPESDDKYREQIEQIAGYRDSFLYGGISEMIILSETVSEFAALRLSDADVMYQFVKPLDPCGLAEKLKRIYSAPHRGEDDTFEKAAFIESVKEILVKLEIYPSYAGYKYIVDAVTAMKYSKGALQLTKDLYPTIGKKYGRSAFAVERAIRFVSGVACGSNEWKNRFPHLDKKLSNSEFISLLTEYADAG